MARVELPIRKADAAALRFAGALGHTHVLIVNGGDDTRYVALETFSEGQARKAAFGEYADRMPAFYSRVAGAWRACAPVPKLTAGQYRALAYARACADDQRYVSQPSTSKGTREMNYTMRAFLHDEGLIQRVAGIPSELVSIYFEITEAGRAALASYEAAHDIGGDHGNP